MGVQMGEMYKLGLLLGWTSPPSVITDAVCLYNIVKKSPSIHMLSSFPKVH
jgi:hypothetical protein